MPHMPIYSNVSGGFATVFTDGTTAFGDGSEASPIGFDSLAATAIYFNVKLVAYGAKGDGSTNDTAAVRAAISAASAAGGGVVYFPAGTYVLGQQGTSQRCLDLPTGVTLMGQSKASTILLLQAGAVSGGRTCRVVFSTSASALSIHNLTIDGNQSNNFDASQQADGIFLDAASMVRIFDVEVRNCAGSGIVVNQNVTDCMIDFCYVRDHALHGIVLGNSGGQKNITTTRTRMTGSQSGFHMETTVNCDNVVVENCYMDSTTGNSALQFVGGTDPTTWATNCTARNCQVVGFVLVAEAQHVLIDNVNVICSDAAPTPNGAMKVTVEGDDITVRNSNFTLTAGGTAAYVVELAGQNPGDTLTNVRFIDNTVNCLSTTAHGILVQTLISAEVRGNHVFGNVSMSAGFYGINVNSKLSRQIDRVIVNDNYITDYPICLVAQGNTGTNSHINSFIACGNRFEQTNLFITAAMSLDLDGHHVIQQSTVYGNENVNNTITTMFATYPNSPMLIGGNRGAGGDYSCNGTPLNVIVESIGARAFRRDGGANTTGYTKEANNGASTGWVAK